VLKNLLSNAVKFTDKGKVTIIVEYEYDELSIPPDACCQDPAQ
jgi:signal transduction histidine kinase